jgi:hypothetical protein
MVNHIYHDVLGSGYTFQINTPRRLNFGGAIFVDRFDNHGASDISISIFTSPGDWLYVLGLAEVEVYSYVTETGTNVSGVSSVSFGSAVDRNGRPLGRHPNDEEESYSNWLVMYEERYENIMRHFRDMKEIFGEDAFR